MLTCKELISSSQQKIYNPTWLCSTQQHFNVTLFLLVSMCCVLVSMCCDMSKVRKRCNEVFFCFVVFVFKWVSSTVTAVLGRKSVKNKWIPRVTAYAMKFGARNWTWLMPACVCHAAGLHAMVSQLCWFSVEKKFTAPANEAGNRWDLSPAHQTLKLWIASQKGKTMLAQRTGVWTNQLGSFVTEHCMAFSLGCELRLAVVLQVRLTALFLSE